MVKPFQFYSSGSQAYTPYRPTEGGVLWNDRGIIKRTSNALNFNGSSQYLLWGLGGVGTMPTAPSYNEDWSIEFEIIGPTDAGFLASWGSTTDADPFIAVHSSTDKLKLRIRDASNVVHLDIESTQVVLDGTRHHFKVEGISNDFKMYVDGVEDATTGTVTSYTTPTFNRFCLAALGRSTITNHASATMLNFRYTLEGTTELEMRLDEGAGTTANDSSVNDNGTFVTGQSGNSWVVI
jgi:hypothetical protein